MDNIKINNFLEIIETLIEKIGKSIAKNPLKVSQILQKAKKEIKNILKLMQNNPSFDSPELNHRLCAALDQIGKIQLSNKPREIHPLIKLNIT